MSSKDKNTFYCNSFSYFAIKSNYLHSEKKSFKKKKKKKKTMPTYPTFFFFSPAVAWDTHNFFFHIFFLFFFLDFHQSVYQAWPETCQTGSASLAIPTLFLVSPDKLHIKDTNMVFSKPQAEQCAYGLQCLSFSQWFYNKAERKAEPKIRESVWW